MFNDIGGRKFIFALFVILLGFILVVTKFVDSATWLTFVNITGATYVVGNLGDSYVKNKTTDKG